MNLDLIALALRAVACRRWRWLAGSRGIGIRTAPLGAVGGRVSDLKSPIYPGALPDLTDPATLGCLLALVREAWGDSQLVAIYCEAANPGQSEGWAVQAADNRMPVAGENYATEVEALVVALEAAP